MTKEKNTWHKGFMNQRLSFVVYNVWRYEKKEKHQPSFTVILTVSSLWNSLSRCLPPPVSLRVFLKKNEWWRTWTFSTVETVCLFQSQRSLRHNWAFSLNMLSPSLLRVALSLFFLFVVVSKNGCSTETHRSKAAKNIPSWKFPSSTFSLAVYDQPVCSSCSRAAKCQRRGQRRGLPHPLTPFVHDRFGYVLPYTPAVTSVPAESAGLQRWRLTLCRRVSYGHRWGHDIIMKTLAWLQT